VARDNAAQINAANQLHDSTRINCCPFPLFSENERRIIRSSFCLCVLLCQPIFLCIPSICSGLSDGPFIYVCIFSMISVRKLMRLSSCLSLSPAHDFLGYFGYFNAGQLARSQLVSGRSCNRPTRSRFSLVPEQMLSYVFSWYELTPWS
jgi:hypothetical protein